MSFMLVLAQAACFRPTPAPEPVPDYCALTSDISFTQAQFELLAEDASHILRYLIEQRETREAEGCLGKGSQLVP